MSQRSGFLTKLHLAMLLAWKDCLIRVQSGVTAVFLVILPLAMVLLTGLAFQGFEPGRLSVTMALIDQDGGPVAGQIRTQLEHWSQRTSADAADPFEPDVSLHYLAEGISEEAAREKVRTGKWTGVLILPRGLSQKLDAGKEARLELITGPRQSAERSILEAEIDILVSHLREQKPRPLHWHISHEETAGSRVVRFNSFAQAVAGNGVMFILLNCILIGGMSIVRERDQNTLDRLMLSPLSPPMIYLGKVLGVYILGMVQALVIFGFGVLVGVELGSALGVALVTALFILVGCALALMISALVRREQTVQDLGAAVSLLMSALGGGMFPLQMAPDWMRRAALLFPTGWAMQAYEKLMWEGGTWTAVIPNLLVLSAFAAVFFFVGSRTLRSE